MNNNVIGSYEDAIKNTKNAVGNIVYELNYTKMNFQQWIVYYMEYRKLKGLAARRWNDENFVNLANELREALVNASSSRVICFSEADRRNLEIYTKDLKSEMGISKKLK